MTMEPHFRDDRVCVYLGDCVEVMASMEPDSVDAIVTDPPYDLTSIVNRFGKAGSAPAKPEGMGGAYARLTKGFMGQTWDGTGIAFKPETWRAALRVLKPGGHLLAFGGTRTSHRMVCAIEDAGFDIRDALVWLYGTGWPKSTGQLKPAHEPIVLARAPGRGAPLNVDGCRIGTSKDVPASPTGSRHKYNRGWRDQQGDPDVTGSTGWNPNLGRWPANIVLDEAAAALLDAATGPQRSGGTPSRRFADKTRHTYGTFTGREHVDGIGASEGNVSRFFYTAKASPSERQGVTHPTVKPVALMRWLCRLVTPPGGVVLDCFAGSGTTRLAALAEGFRVILIEQNADYLDQLCGRAAQQGLPLDGDAAG